MTKYRHLPDYKTIYGLSQAGEGWYPLADYELRAPVVWVTIPRIKGFND